jgi:hypothetical protein
MSKQVLTATALALLIGVSGFGFRAALAQNGGDARSHDRAQQKKLDDRDLTPVRPIRRVGEDSWPDAKNRPAARETTGQSAKDSTNEKKEDTAQNTAKPEPKNPNLGNQSPPPDKPQDTAKQNAQPKQDPAKQDTKRDNARPETKQAQQPASHGDKTQDTAQGKDDQKTNEQKSAQTGGQSNEQKAADRKTDKNFASIRLGTDASGRVAVNDSQEKQLSSVLRKHHAETFNVKVSVGSVAPANVRVIAVSSDFIDIFPQFRGYSYFTTGDDIVLVEPSSKKVVALIPLKTTATASRPSEERTVSKSNDERTTVRSTDTRPNSRSKTVVKERDVAAGAGYPTEEEILAAPVARAPAGTAVTRSYRTYRYEPYYDDDDVVVIERRPHRPRFFPFW